MKKLLITSITSLLFVQFAQGADTFTIKNGTKDTALVVGQYFDKTFGEGQEESSSYVIELMPGDTKTIPRTAPYAFRHRFEPVEYIRDIIMIGKDASQGKYKVALLRDDSSEKKNEPLLTKKSASYEISEASYNYPTLMDHSKPEDKEKIEDYILYNTDKAAWQKKHAAPSAK